MAVDKYIGEILGVIIFHICDALTFSIGFFPHLLLNYFEIILVHGAPLQIFVKIDRIYSLYSGKLLAFLLLDKLV